MSRVGKRQYIPFKQRQQQTDITQVHHGLPQKLFPLGAHQINNLPHAERWTAVTWVSEVVLELAFELLFCLVVPLLWDCLLDTLLSSDQFLIFSFHIIGLY